MSMVDFFHHLREHRCSFFFKMFFYTIVYGALFKWIVGSYFSDYLAVGGALVYLVGVWFISEYN